MSNQNIFHNSIVDREYYDQRYNCTLEPCDTKCGGSMRMAIRSNHHGCVYFIAQKNKSTAYGGDVELAITLKRPLILQIMLSSDHYSIMNEYMETSVHNNSHKCFRLLCDTNASYPQATFIAVQHDYHKIFKVAMRYLTKFIIGLPLLINIIENDRPEYIQIFPMASLGSDSKRARAFWCAITNNRTRCLHMLLKNLQFKLSEKYLYHTIHNGQYDCVKLLIQYNCPIGIRALTIGINSDHRSIVDMLIRKKVGVLETTETTNLLYQYRTHHIFKRIWDTNRALFNVHHIQLLQPVFTSYKNEIERVSNLPSPLASIVFDYT